MLVQEQDYLMHDAFLEHYGVPGMKWGVRKERRQAIKAARKKFWSDNKRANKEIKEYKKANEKGLAKFFVPHDINRAYSETKKRDKIAKTVSKMRQKKYDQNMDNMAAYAKAKKYGKSKEKQEKAEQKVYTKLMSRYGSMGSALDVSSGGQSTHLYERLKKQKGKKYADTVAKKARNKHYRDAAIGVGLIAGAHLLKKYRENH